MELREIKEAIEKIDRASYPVYFDELLTLEQDIMLKELSPLSPKRSSCYAKYANYREVWCLGYAVYELYTDNEFC